MIEELRPLHNAAYHDRPVSLYGGVVDLPLVVYRDPEVSWFGDRDALTEGACGPSARRRIGASRSS